MKTRLMRNVAVGFLALGLVCGLRAGDAKNAQRGHDDEHVVVRPASVKWGPAPPALPPGAKVAVLVGDPGKAGAAYTIRAKMPDGYQVPPHWHPAGENVTAIKGILPVDGGGHLRSLKTE